MTQHDIITVWKSEAHRLALPREGGVPPPNPAGASPLDRIDLDAAGGAVPATVVLGSAWLSCTFACSETMWDGTCDFFTYGCC